MIRFALAYLGFLLLNQVPGSRIRAPGFDCLICLGIFGLPVIEFESQDLMNEFVLAQMFGLPVIESYGPGFDDSICLCMFGLPGNMTIKPQDLVEIEVHDLCDVLLEFA